MGGLIPLVNTVFTVFWVLLLVRVIMSWIPGMSYGHPAVRVVHQLTSPILDPIRRMLPPVGGLDLSPLLAFMLLRFVQAMVVNILLSL
jgi:YggT family protein